MTGTLAKLLVEQAVVFAWVLGRIAGFLVTAPLPGNEVPQTARVSFALALAWVVSGYATPAAPVLDLNLATVMVVAAELGCGLAMGFVFRLLLGVSDTAGDMIAHAIGLQSGAIFSPTTGSTDPTLSRIISLAAMLLAVGIGAHRVALAHVLESFRVLPVGTPLFIGAAGPTVAALVGELLATSLRLALPVVAVCLLTQLGLALIARSAPSMQIFSVGLAVTLGAGLVTLMAAAGGLGAGFARTLSTLPTELGRLLLLLR